MAYKFTSSRQLQSILNNIETVHKKDINDFAGGHLNEAFLYYSPAASNRKSWQSAQEELPRLRTSSRVSKRSSPRKSKPKSTDMHEALFQFSLGTSGSVPQATGQRKKECSNVLKKQETPSVFHDRISHTTKQVPSSAQSLYSKVQDKVLIEEIKPPDLLLPTPRSLVRKTAIPEDLEDVQDGDSYYPDVQILRFRQSFHPTYHMGVTKSDQYKKLKTFETSVLRKQDSTEQNVLSGIKAVKHLEQNLNQDLEQLNMNGGGPNFHKLQIYSNSLEEVIQETPTFGHILRSIKTEYDAYIAELLDSQTSQHRLLKEQVEQMSTRGTSRPKEFEIAKNRVSELETEAIFMLEENERLRRELAEEKELQNDQSEPGEAPQIILTFSNESPTELADEIEHTKAIILEKLDALKDLRVKLRDDCVPLTVCTHLEQCIKETEIEVQKLLKQNEYYERSIDEMETDLKESIQEADTSERDAKRIWRKVNSMRGLPKIGLMKRGGMVNEESDEDDEEDKWNWYIS